jgi:hypothetical protein
MRQSVPAARVCVRGDLRTTNFKENDMHVPQRNLRASLVAMLTVAALMAGGCSTMKKMGEKVGIGDKSELTGQHEVPPVTTKATGKSTIAVASDKSVSGTVTVTDMTATAAHIHRGAASVSGPVIIPLKKTSDKTFIVPDNTKLTDEQFAALKNGELYVNVHSAAHPGGEVRVQLKP